MNLGQMESLLSVRVDGAAGDPKTRNTVSSTPLLACTVSTVPVIVATLALHVRRIKN